MTTKNCANGPKLVLKDLCEKSFVRNVRLPLFPCIQPVFYLYLDHRNNRPTTTCVSSEYEHLEGHMMRSRFLLHQHVIAILLIKSGFDHFVSLHNRLLTANKNSHMLQNLEAPGFLGAVFKNNYNIAKQCEGTGGGKSGDQPPKDVYDTHCDAGIDISGRLPYQIWVLRPSVSCMRQ
ncbi:hypothetical protein pdam_00020569 [Pocillopora damicornis]|uniref:Uncharacterized protein n=1 Tax=Pocillopora damicornis TaxID=46731 RepID=A0A3M6V373_POCDA|nr:hypothetical protein pdam_00020569 [Pocillopora damicornis]